MKHQMILFLPFSVFQLQDCIQATLTDWLSSTKLPSEVGNLLGFCLFLCKSVLYVQYVLLCSYIDLRVE